MKTKNFVTSFPVPIKNRDVVNRDICKNHLLNVDNLNDNLGEILIFTTDKLQSQLNDTTNMTTETDEFLFLKYG